jgi:hypothetical protein
MVAQKCRAEAMAESDGSCRCEIEPIVGTAHSFLLYSSALAVDFAVPASKQFSNLVVDKNRF